MASQFQKIFPKNDKNLSKIETSLLEFHLYNHYLAIQQTDVRIDPELSFCSVLGLSISKSWSHKCNISGD